MLLENIWRRVVGNILMNISTSNISWNMLLAKRFHQNNQAVSAAVSINGLRFGHKRQQQLYSIFKISRNIQKYNY